MNIMLEKDPVSLSTETTLLKDLEALDIMIQALRDSLLPTDRRHPDHAVRARRNSLIGISIRGLTESRDRLRSLCLQHQVEMSRPDSLQGPGE